MLATNKDKDNIHNDNANKYKKLRNARVVNMISE